MTTEQHPQQPAQRPAARPDPRTPKGDRAAKIKSIFRSRAHDLAALFPDHGMVMVARAVQTACSVSQGLELDVTAESIAEAAIACHHLGLEVGDQAYIYPFKRQAKLTIGPRGLIALAYRSGEMRSIKAESVFRGDHFVYDLGDDSISHRKAETGRRPRGKSPEELITHTWARIITRHDAAPILLVLTAEDLAFYRSFSQASSGPWFQNFEGMARKTALKRVLEFVPRSPLLASAMAEEEDGTYAIPEELLETIKGRTNRAAPEPEPETKEEPAAADDGTAAKGRAA